VLADSVGSLLRNERRGGSMAEIPEEYRDLLEKPPRFGALATVGADGTPQVTEMGFLFDDGRVRMTATDDRQKVKNLRRNPLCSMLIVDPDNPMRTLEIRGRGAVDLDPDYEFAGRIASANGRSGDDLRRQDLPGTTRVRITIEPTRVRPFG
jgi:PPOX class probable F420-dependent enzyme